MYIYIYTVGGLKAAPHSIHLRSFHIAAGVRIRYVAKEAPRLAGCSVPMPGWLFRETLNP